MNESALMEMTSLPDIVIHLNGNNFVPIIPPFDQLYGNYLEALMTVTIDQFKDMNKCPISLSRLRVLRIQYKKIFEYGNRY